MTIVLVVVLVLQLLIITIQVFEFHDMAKHRRRQLELMQKERR